MLREITLREAVERIEKEETVWAVNLENKEKQLEAPRKYKVWPKGTLISTREYYKPDYFEEQMELDELPFI